MATYTDNYNLTKPTMAEDADIRTINGNMDKIDEVMHSSQVSIAEAYSNLDTYKVGDMRMYEKLLYECITPIDTPETWDPTKWKRAVAVDAKPDVMTGATSTEDGKSGLVPAPSTTDKDKYFKGDGSWGTPPGGGTTVIPNPQGTPTDTLSTIGIGDTIFDIAGGGSGGGTSFKKTTLWKNTNGAGVGTYMLDESIDNYDFITVRYGKWDDYAGATPLCDYRILSVKDLQAMHDEGIYVVFTGYESRVAYCDFNDDVMQVTFINGNQLILQVDGIKIGSGSGSGSGYTTTLLYDSGSLVNGAPYAQDIALLDNLSNYDMALLILGNSSDLSQANTSGTATAIIDTSFTLTDSETPYYDFHWAGYQQRWMLTHFTDTTFNVRMHGGDVNQTIYRIYGIKFSGGGSGNANYTELTQAEYDALTPEEQMNGTIYFITDGSGGGGGSGSYSETVIYENTGSTQESNMMLTDDIAEYDLILFEAYVNADNRLYTMSNIYRASTIISGWNTTLLRWSPSDQYINVGYVSSTELTCYASSGMYIKRIVGLKCSGGSDGSSEGINYSTEEQDTGIKWIDGKTIYQKTIILKENGVNKYTYANEIYQNCLPQFDYIKVDQIFVKRGDSTYIDVSSASNEFYFTPNSNQNLYFNNTHNPTDIIITIQYTKSTT